MNINTFVRNLSFTSRDGRDISSLAIRPEITPYDYISDILGAGRSLLFKGYIRGREFVINSIFDIPDTEQLDFESVCSFIPTANTAFVNGNFFIEDLQQTESLTSFL